MPIKQKSQTLHRAGNSLAQGYIQLKVLNASDTGGGNIPAFVRKAGREIFPTIPEVLQINIGKLCNQTCAHCHVDAGPDRKKENMTRETLQKCLDILKKVDIPTVDITGGAPEMNPHYRWFVESCVAMEKKVMTRCNLTIISAHKKYSDLPDFFADNQVQIISSLPHFSRLRTDSQRGKGVFDQSIKALQLLNKKGYGKENSGLELDLVYNPSGAYLPGNQASLEKEFKTQLKRKFNIEFNSLYVITNLPVSRFLDYLVSSENYDRYMTELVEAFNPNTLDHLMCRNTLSISWDGFIYDCDFNQMLDLKVDAKSNHIDHFDLDELMNRKIQTNQHCFGCTAGAGSSCGGEIV